MAYFADLNRMAQLFEMFICWCGLDDLRLASTCAGFVQLWVMMYASGS